MRSSFCRGILPTFLTIISSGLITPALRGQSAGPNVNMVSGTGWTNGDPFLQRQNEPSIAVSTRNTLHLLAGANDYRGVDLPGLLGSTERGDAWLGLFKSFDGGQTWQSTLLPGYPLDQTKEPNGLPSPIHGFQAAADPTVRPGSSGLFYYSGIAFNRGTGGTGVVFVSRFIDNNNKENGDPTHTNGTLTTLAPTDPMQYLGTVVVDSGTAGQFLDKPWIATDIPRGSATCQVPFTKSDGTQGTQTIPAGMVYLTYSSFTGSTSSKIMFTSSADCGATWGHSVKLSESNSVNQGTIVVVDPSSASHGAATIYVAWRRFITSSQPDAMMIAKSTDGGITFSKAVAAVNFPSTCVVNTSVAGCPFDQAESAAEFRTNAFPGLTVDDAGRVYMAWSERQANGDARITMQVSADGSNWGASALVDNGGVADDYGNALLTNAGTSLSRGHQLMPAISFIAGKLTLTYYDEREDHTLGFYTPKTDLTGYTEIRELLGELAGNAASNLVFNSVVSDAAPPLISYRHTIDIEGAQASTISGGSLTVPSFTAFRISKYAVGLNPNDSLNPGQVEQLQVSPPNLPMFALGTEPFDGDYIDIAPAPAFVFQGGAWKFNTGTANLPVFHASWTDNRDVRPPANGDWTKYVPPFSRSNPTGGQPSLLDPTQTVPVCVLNVNDGFTATRNQNIYTSIIAPGLVVGSLGNSKTLGFSPSNPGQLLQRAFTVTLRNTSSIQRNFRILVGNQPALANGQLDPGGQASLLQFSLQTSLDVSIASNASVARAIFVQAANPTASVTINIQEISAPGGSVVAGGLTGSVTLNPDPNAPAIQDPDSFGFANPTISTTEIHNPIMGTPTIITPPVGNSSILAPAITNPAITNPAITNPAITNPAITNPALLSALNPAITNPAITNPAITNPAITNPAITNPAITNTSITDASFPLTNTGNTTTSYAVKLFQRAPLASGVNLQLLLVKQYLTPIANGCNLAQSTENIVVADVPNPVFTPVVNLGDPNLPDPAITNATIALAPGETGQVVIRANVGNAADMQNLVLNNLVPVAVAHPANTGVTFSPATLTILSLTLPGGVTGATYNAQVNIFGGVAPRVASITNGALPAGLTLDPATGIISGTPTATGSFSFTFQVADSSNTPAMVSQNLTILIVSPLAITATSLPSGLAGQPYIQLLQTTGGSGAIYTWSATGLPSFLAIDPSSGTMSVPPGQTAVPGTYSLVVSVSDPGPPPQNVTQSFSLTFTENTSVTVTARPSSALFGAPVAVTVTVKPAFSGTPTGTVSVSDATGASCAATLAGGTGHCTLTPQNAGADALTATYSGDTSYNSSAGSTPFEVSQTGTTTTLTVALTAVVGQPVTINFTVQASGSPGTPTGNVSVTDGAGDSCVPANVSLSSGAGTCVLTVTGLGNVTLAAKYAGTANYVGNTGTAALQVAQATTSTVVSTSQTNVVSGQSLTANFSVAANAPSTGNPLPTGSVTVTNLTGGSCTGALNVGSCSLLVGSSGASSLTGVYSGDTNYAGSASPASSSLSVGKASTTTSVTATPNPSAVGQAVTVSVAIKPAFAGTPTGTVSIADATGASCLATISPATGKWSCALMAKFAAGSDTITATYSGDSNFGGSFGAVSQTVNKANTVLTLATLPNSAFGQPVIVTVAVASAFGGVPTGAVAVSDSTGASCSATLSLSSGTGQCSLVPATTGADTIAANYAGDSNFNGSSNQAGEQVNKANTTVKVVSSPNPSLLNQVLTVTFAVTPNAPGAGTPTGRVTVSDSTGANCSAPLATGNCTLTPKSAGNDTITATYAGDSNFNGVSGTVAEEPVQYKFTGFLSPLGPAGTYSGALNAGKVVPVKWSLTDFSGNFISSASSLSTMLAYFNGPPPASGVCPIATSSGSVLLYSPTAGAAGGSTFRYSSGQFVFNWDTTSADPFGRGCFTLSIQLNDGSAAKQASLQLQ